MISACYYSLLSRVFFFSGFLVFFILAIFAFNELSLIPIFAFCFLFSIISFFLLSKDKNRFFIITLTLLLPFASADFFITGLPPQIPHLGGAQSIPEINTVDILMGMIIMYLFLTRSYLSIKVPKGISISFLLFVFWSGLTIITSDYKILGIVSLVELIKIGLLGAIYFILLDKSEYMSLAVSCLLVGLLIQSLFGIYQALFGFPQWLYSFTQGNTTTIEKLNRYAFLRVGGTIGWPTTFAQYLELLIPLAFSLCLAAKDRLHTFLFAVPLGLSLATLILTLSRAGWISSAISLGVTSYLLFAKMKYLYFRKRLFVGFSIIIIVGILFIPLISERFISYDYGSASNRIPMWHVASRMILGNPIFGTGLNTYSEVMHDYDRNNIIYGFTYPVHNVYLFIAAEIGIPGLIFLISFFFLVMRSLFKSIKSADLAYKPLIIGLFGGLLSVFSHGFFEPSFKQEPQLWYVLSSICGLSAAAVRLSSYRGCKKNS